MKGDQNGLIVHRDYKNELNHNIMNVHIEHSNMVGVCNLAKRHERLPTSLMENCTKLSVVKGA